MMNPHFCNLLALVSWIASVISPPPESDDAASLILHTHGKTPLLGELAEVPESTCSDALSNYIVLYSVTGLMVIIPVTGIPYSYSKIISSILKMSSVEGRYKAFSTCGSHLTVISLYYGTGLGVYLSSAFSPSSSKWAVASVMYTVVTPMLNHFIYSLRNRDMQGALRKFVSRSFFPL